MARHLGPAGDLQARLTKVRAGQAKKKKKKKGRAFPGAAEPFNGRRPPGAKTGHV